MERHKILIVDDEPAVLDTLERSLVRQYTVFRAGSGEEVLEVLGREDIALTIADQRMPGMTGVHMLMKSRKIRPHMIRILLTGFTDIDAAVDAINMSGIYRYIQKPWDTEEFQINIRRALEAYDRMANYAGSVTEGEEIPAADYQRPEWIDLPFEDARISAPAIHAAATSENLQTGLWRTQRPVIDYTHCKRCWWVCSTLCPDSAISLNDDGFPQIDYEHCKGCMICMAQCPSHAIRALAEREADVKDTGGGAS